MNEKNTIKEEEKKEVLGVLYDEFKDTVEWNYFAFKKKIRQSDDKTENK